MGRNESNPEDSTQGMSRNGSYWVATGRMRSKLTDWLKRPKPVISAWLVKKMSSKISQERRSLSGTCPGRWENQVAGRIGFPVSLPVACLWRYSSISGLIQSKPRSVD